MSDALTVSLPWPHEMLFPNRRAHGFAKAEIVKISRSVAKGKAREAYGDNATLPQRPCLVVYFHPPNNRPDMDNSHTAIKSYQDGIADALGVNDRVFRRAVLIWGEVRKDDPCVIFQVRSADGLSEWLGVGV